MKKLSYFIGKPCTILTRPASRMFEEEQHANVFVGIIEEVDEFGVWVLQLNGRKKSFFFHHSLVGIIEETITTFSPEEAVILKKELEKRLPVAENKPNDVISLESLKVLKKTANKE
jgi:hypothetical protein